MFEGVIPYPTREYEWLLASQAFFNRINALSTLRPYIAVDLFLGWLNAIAILWTEKSTTL